MTDTQGMKEQVSSPSRRTCIVVIWGERLNDPQRQPLSDLIEQRPTPRMAHTTCPYRGFPKSSTEPQIAIIPYRHVPSPTYESHAQWAIRARLTLLDMIRNSHRSLRPSLHQPCKTISWHRWHSRITFNIQDLCGDSLHYINEPPLLNKPPLPAIFQLTTSPSVFRLTIALPYCTPWAWGTAFMSLFVYINDVM